MIHKELYLNLSYNQKVILSIVIVAVVVLISIVAKMKKRKTAKKTVRTKKIRRTFSVDCNTFINANFKKQDFLYENKNRTAELIRLLNY